MSSDALIPYARAGVPEYLDPAVCVAAGHSEVGRRGVISSLKCCARMACPGADWRGFPWAGLHAAHLAILRQRLTDGVAPATGNHRVLALRSVVKELWRQGVISAEERDRRLEALRMKRGRREAPGRMVRPEELAALFKLALPRDQAALALMVGGGLRRAEVCDLKLGDYDPASGDLRVVGKGDKERIVPLPRDARAVVDRWLRIRGSEPGWLVPCLTTIGAVAPAKHLEPGSLWAALAKLGEQCGVATFTPHDLRRTYISTLLGCGVDIATVQRLAGHSSPTTTAGYDRRPREAAARAVEVLRIPGVGDG